MSFLAALEPLLSAHIVARDTKRQSTIVRLLLALPMEHVGQENPSRAIFANVLDVIHQCVHEYHERDHRELRRFFHISREKFPPDVEWVDDQVYLCECMFYYAGYVGIMLMLKCTDICAEWRCIGQYMGGLVFGHNSARLQDIKKYISMLSCLSERQRECILEYSAYYAGKKQTKRWLASSPNITRSR